MTETDDRASESAMSPDEFRVRMQAIADGDGDGDAEYLHKRGDALLMEMLTALGYGDGVDVFEAMPRWYA